jgi:hypothetical protein
MFLGVAGLFLAGCASMGPDSVVRDRFAYTTAISDSWESQMLLNLVKGRYGHAPTFLDVASVISQYTLQTQASVGASWQSPIIDRLGGNINANTLSLGGSGSYTDRPTITYNPLTGEKFARSFMAPIPPDAILSLVQAGYPVDLLFRVCVQSINGIQNRFGGTMAAHDADPEFYILLDKMRKLQATGDIGMKIQRRGEKEGPKLIFRWKDGKTPEEDGAEVRKLLGLDPTVAEFKVVYGLIASDNKEIAILTRSMLQVMIDLASTIEVPAQHLADKRVAPTLGEKAPDGRPIVPIVQVHSSMQRPRDAFLAVPFRDYWFWIDDKDLLSKSVFSFLMFIFTLTETGDKEGAPVVTISAG